MSFKSIAFWLAAVAVGSALCGCGGGHHGGGTGNSGGLTGTFVDIPVQGLAFTASPSGLTGTTDNTGAFKYKAGDTVTFSVDAGGSGATALAIAIGLFKPVAPSGANAQAYVLSLQNGLQIAQVLQSLNHSASGGVANVGGLVLSSAAVNAINAFTSSGGTVLPSGQTDVQMLAAAQASNTAANITFTNPGGVSVATAAGNVVNTIINLNTVAGVNLTPLLSGQTVFWQGDNIPAAAPLSGGTYTFGFATFNSSGTLYRIVASQGPTVSTGTYSISGNTVTLTQGTLVDSLLIAYLDSAQVIWPDSLSDGSAGAGTWNFIDATFGASAIAGKTLTLSGFLSGACSGTPIQFKIDSMGANYTTNCSGSATQTGSGTIAAVSTEPGILSFTDSTSGNVLYFGLVAGTTIANGTMAAVAANVTSPKGGLASVTAQ